MEDTNEVQEFLFHSAHEAGLDFDWVTPSLQLLDEAAQGLNLHRYVKFKCIGTSSESSIFPGLVFTKWPIHDQMLKVHPQDVRPLLWKGSLDLEEEDKESTNKSLSVIEESRANVLLVENSISEEYQTYLFRGEITAIDNMKHRLNRFPNLGFGCTLFSCSEVIEDLNAPANTKHLAFFQGCGSLTILLRGRSTEELKVIKGFLKTGYNRLRNRRLSSIYFLVAMPPLKFKPWDMDVTVPEVLEDEISSFIAYTLLQKTQDEAQDEASTSNPKPKFEVRCLHEEDFSELRRNCSISEEQYRISLSHCDKWEVKGGKSGAVFAKTKDKRFIIKEIRRVEYDSFIKFGSSYFNYLKEAMETSNKTCLAKIFGLYELILELGKPKYLIVMENLVFDRVLSRLYDLKGKVEGRFASLNAEVLLDKYLVEIKKMVPLEICFSSETNFETALRNDTEFLAGVQVMDYSLLVGFDKEKDEMVCGIIDYLVPFSLLKRMESVGKSTFLTPKNTQPTVIEPADYAKRFLSFMFKQFLGENVLKERVNRLEAELIRERERRLVAKDNVRRLEEELVVQKETMLHVLEQWSNEISGREAR